MSLIGKTVEEQMWNFFMARVGNAYGVAALMGHWFAESGLNPKNLQNSFEKKLGYTDESYTKAVDNGSYTNFVHDSAGYGLAQWTYWSRKQNLLCFAQGKGCSVGDTEMQFEFGYRELCTGYKKVLAVMKSAKSVREASDVLLTQYERPADQSEAVKVKRAGYGRKYYEKYAGAETKPQNGGNMAVRIGHASISEKGTINGAKGDQTGGEVCVRSWYSKPWDYMAIHPDAAVREKHAKAVEAACANDNIGYGQNDRNTLNTLAKAAGYDLSRVGKCNCDCSSLQNVAAVASGASGATYSSNGWTTSNMKAALQKLGYKIITDATYLVSAKYCVRGAIYVKVSSHTVCALDNGAEYKRTLEKAGIFGVSVPEKGSGSIVYKVGDVVSFAGTKHYTSANAASGKDCKPGKAKITAISAGAKHPYHLVHMDPTSNVYGWVDAANITEIHALADSEPIYYIVKKGDTLNRIAKKCGTSVNAIVQLNTIANANMIFAGQKIGIK